MGLNEEEFGESMLGEILLTPPSSSNHLSFHTQHSYHRLLTHALCAYHGLKSKSKTYKGEKQVHISLPTSSSSSSFPQIPLHLLLSSSNQPDNWTTVDDISILT